MSNLTKRGLGESDGRAITSAEEFRSRLLTLGLLVDGGAIGLYHRSATFESIVRSIEALASKAGRDQSPRQLYFSPVIGLATLLGSGYVSAFPNLIGTINSFDGDGEVLRELRSRVDAGGQWVEMTSPTEVALCSASCHSLYPMLAHTTQPEGGSIFEVQASCFRHEPSLDPARMQSFRQHEFVYVGTAPGALEFRDQWLERGRALLGGLGLGIDVVPASDPFFGRGAQLLSRGQLDKELKFEIVAPISSTQPGAVASSNYHEDHFGAAFDLKDANGQVAHTACIGFGLERITLALLLKLGFDPALWPGGVRQQLDISVERPSALS